MAIAALAALLPLVLATQASAAQVRAFKEVFGDAAQPTFVAPGAMAVDQSSGDLLVADAGNKTLSRFKANGEPDDFAALGTNVIDGESGEDETPQGGILSNEGFGTEGEAEVGIAPTGAAGGTEGDIYVTDAFNGVIDIFASTGKYLGQISAGYSCGVTVAPDGNVYVGDFNGLIHKFVPSAPATFTNPANFSSPGPCQVAAGAGPSEGYVFAASFLGAVTKIAAEGPEEGEAQYTVAAGAHTSLTVDPATGDLFAAIDSQVKEYDASGAGEAIEVAPPLTASSAVGGVAVDAISGDTYIARSGSPQIEIFGPVTNVPLVITEAASDLQAGGATLHGMVDPEGLQLQECAFEYGQTSISGFEAAVPCSPGAGEIPADFSTHAVTSAVTGLQPNTTYRFRLKVSTPSGTSKGTIHTFMTQGPPTITEVRALNADHTSASIEAKINPSGSLTNYFVEWGPTTAYGRRIPAGSYEPSIGSGESPVTVSVELTGLVIATTYHYRLVATNANGLATTGDHELETLDSCGLPQQRCFELVSPRDPGPIADPGESVAGVELSFQSAREPGTLAYSIETGLPDATTGAEVLYLGARTGSGWASAQLSAPIAEVQQSVGQSSRASRFLGLSPDLSCGVLVSTQPLADDAVARPAIESGGANLYRRNPDGAQAAFTLISNLPVTNGSEVAEAHAAGNGALDTYKLVGMSHDCRTVAFETEYKYPGLEGKNGSGNSRLYESRGGVLRAGGMVPAPSGEEPTNGVGGDSSGLNATNAVSEDGARIFFSGNRLTATNASEVGHTGVFVHEAGRTEDLSETQGALPDLGAAYQSATPDGSRVFFTANAGLTATTSSEGTDLYEYDLEDHSLTDLSADTDGGGAEVGAFLGSSRAGNTVYFAARGQLDPGRGNSYQLNQSANAYSVYEESAGDPKFVGSVSSGDLSSVALSNSRQINAKVTTQVSPDGRYLLFESSRSVTAYQSGGVPEAYLYDAVKAETVCVSCRQDGLPSVASASYHPLQPAGTSNPLSQPQTLADEGGQARVFFSSRDPLAPGAVAGAGALYEWVHGQVFRVAGERAGLGQPGNESGTVYFVGASADGSDAYLVTRESLNWEDPDERSSVYDARIGGGFPEPAAAPPPCDAGREGGCQIPAPPPAAAPSAASGGFTGPGNPKPKHHHKKHHHKKHHHKKHHHKKHHHKKHHHKKHHHKKHHHKKQKRANAKRRVGK